MAEAAVDFPRTFVRGCPPEPCREYTPEERDAMWIEVFGKHTTEAADGALVPTAVFVCGLPGSGKSSTLDTILSRLPLPTQGVARGCAVVDTDTLRAFHADFRARLEDVTQYEGLVEWFLKGTNFEEDIFRSETGLMQRALREQRSFVQLATMRTRGFLGWVEYVASRGYNVHLQVVHVPLEIVLERTVSRAHATGRWTPPSFIRECDHGLREHTQAIWSVVRALGGSTSVIDNSGAKGTCPVVLGDGAPPLLDSPLPVQAAQDLVLEAELLSETRVRALAETNLAPLGLLGGDNAPAGSPRFSLAGGAFKSLLKVGATKPRDLDLWPCETRDFDALKVALLKAGAVPMSSSEFSAAFRALDGTIVEVANKVHAGGVEDVVSGFDIGLSAVGCEIAHGAVVRVFVNETARDSLRQREPLLLLGPVRSTDDSAWDASMPNELFLLATAERVVRYARAMEWPHPNHQLEFLLARWKRVSVTSEVRNEYIARYKSTSVDKDARSEVCKMFDVAMW